jgi:hypothetical protein
MKNQSFITIFSITLMGMSLGACSSSSGVLSVTDATTTVGMPHPENYELAALKSLFKHPNAPKAVLGEFADRCDEDFNEKNATQLVQQDAERMHWCFYAKLYRLQESLQGNIRWNIRQKKVKDAFQFLSPVAFAFQQLKQDSHYLAWEKHFSTQTNEWVFFKKKSSSNRAPASVIPKEFRRKKPRSF